MSRERSEMRLRSIDPKAVKKIMREHGCSWEEALLVAATEMEGVREEDGEVWGTQTYCDELDPGGFMGRFGRGRRRRRRE